jgi:isopenicillin N synthase-like dioxygenase
MVFDGILLQAWSNGRFVSVLHRALVNETAERLSIVFPFSPAADYNICIPPCLVDEEHPLLYQSPIEWHHLAVIKGNHVAKDVLSANFGLKST